MRRKIPLPPVYLNDEARQEWARITREMHKEGLITALDVAQIASYCILVARISEAQRAIEAEGTIITMPSGIKRPNPWIAVMNSAVRQVSAVGGTLGLSPSSRTHVALTEAGQKRRYENSFIK